MIFICLTDSHTAVSCQDMHILLALSECIKMTACCVCIDAVKGVSVNWLRHCPKNKKASAPEASSSAVMLTLIRHYFTLCVAAQREQQHQCISYNNIASTPQCKPVIHYPLHVFQIASETGILLSCRPCICFQLCIQTGNRVSGMLRVKVCS